MKNIIAEEKGFILVTAMVVLLLLVLIGIGAMRTSSIEVLIAGNDKFHKEAFYSADSGVYLTPKLITMARDAGVDPAGPQIVSPPPPPLPRLLPPQSIYLFGDVAKLPDETWNYSASDGTRFYDETMGYVQDAIALAPDFQVQVGMMPVDVDIARSSGSEAGVGQGAEFGMGASGVGAGGPSGTWIRYTLTAFGQSPKNTVSVVSAGYRYVPGTAGGLK
jgi:hypothetical protein